MDLSNICEISQRPRNVYGAFTWDNQMVVKYDQHVKIKNIKNHSSLYDRCIVDGCHLSQTSCSSQRMHNGLQKHDVIHPLRSLDT